MEGDTRIVHKQNGSVPLAEIDSVHETSTWDAFYGNVYSGECTAGISSKMSDESNVGACSDGEGQRRSLKRKKSARTDPGKPQKCFSVSKKDICKKARNSGKSYVKLKGKETGAFVEEKAVGPDCLCPNKCFDKVGEETVQKIFRDFWALGDYNSQNAYLFGLINILGVKRRYTKNQASRRNFTITYCIKKKGENVNVCKKAFLNIHGLQRNRGRINNLANKMKGGQSVPPPDQRGRHTNRPNAYSDEAVFHVRNHLAECPKIERKKNSTKPSKHMEYSTKRCYDLYVAVYCKEHNLLPVSLDKYRRIFWEEGYRNPQSSPRRTQGSVIPSNVTIRKLSF